MLDNIVIGRFFKEEGYLHSFHPFVKLWILLIFSFLIGVSDNIKMIIVLTSILLLLMYLSKVPIKMYFKLIKSIKLLLILTFLTIWIFHHDIFYALLMMLKFIDLVLLGSMYLYVTKLKDILAGIQIFLYPLRYFKINWQEISFILFLAIRFIPVIIDISNQIIKSLICRGFNYYQSFIQKIKAIPMMIYPIISKTLNVTMQFSDTLLMRNFSFESNQKIHFNNWQKKDAFVFVGSIIGILFLMIKEV